MKNVILISFVVISISSHLALPAYPSADYSGDGLVDYEDFALMGGQWLNEYDCNDLTVMANQWLSTDSNIPDDMVYIPGGGFEMGDHHDGLSDAPLHTVLVDAFFMSKFEITNQQYCDYLNSALGSGSIYLSSDVVYGTGNDQGYCDTSASSSWSQIVYSGGVFSVRTKPEVGGRDMSDDPMVMVSWYGAVAYCNWRSSEEGQESCYNLSTWDCDFTKKGYRLPTEAEWEYAARGGEYNPYYRFPWGDTISHSQANYFSYWEENSPYYPYDVSPTEDFHPDWDYGGWPYTSMVGSFAANSYGLYDMAGNVCEWCNDWYDSDYYDTSPYDNPTGPISGSYRVLRGGGWDNSASNCRVAARGWWLLDFPYRFLGFRIVLVP